MMPMVTTTTTKGREAVVRARATMILVGVCRPISSQASVQGSQKRCTECDRYSMTSNEKKK
jgi:hypothetical protein